mgnify:CR=1 FL=1
MLNKVVIKLAHALTEIFPKMSLDERSFRRQTMIKAYILFKIFESILQINCFI